MKRSQIGLIVIGVFILFYYILPQIFYALGIDSVFVHALFRFFSFILVPLFMYRAFEFISDVKYIAVAFFLVSLAFLLAELSYYNFTPFLNFILGVSLYLLVLITLYFFVMGLILEPTYYFKRRVGIALVITSFLLVLRYSSIMYIVYAIIYDINSSTGIRYLSYFQSIDGIFVLYSIFGYLVLNFILFERDKYA